MRMIASAAKRVAALVGCGLFIALPGQASANPIADPTEQTVVVILARNLLEHRLPDVMQIEHGRFLMARDVQRACATSSFTAESTLLFFPDSKTCERVTDQKLISLPDRLQKITGRWLAIDPLTRAQNELFVAITPPSHSPTQMLAMCGCSVDVPPEGASSCSTQTRTAGTSIGAVEFMATDADTPTLTGQFSYQRDADPAEMGLPPEITSSCTSGTGTLQCTLTGSAPAPAGFLQFTFDVSDGTYTLPLETSLQVLAAGDRIFADNFEVVGCP